MANLVEYVKTVWENGKTALNAARMNNMEQGISNCATQINKLGDSVSRIDWRQQVVSAKPNLDTVIAVEPPEGFHSFLGVVGLSWWPNDSWNYAVVMKYDHDIGGKSFITIRPVGNFGSEEQAGLTLRFGVVYQ